MATTYTICAATKKIKEQPMSETKETHKGWEISHNPPPVPIRSFDWIAVHPDYEAWTEDGEWVSNNLILHAANKRELFAEIDEWELENA